MNKCRMTKLIIIVKTTRHLRKNEYYRYNIQVHRTRNKILIYLAININGKVYEYIATYVDDICIVAKKLLKTSIFKKHSSLKSCLGQY